MIGLYDKRQFYVKIGGGIIVVTGFSGNDSQ